MQDGKGKKEKGQGFDVRKAEGEGEEGNDQVEQGEGIETGDKRICIEVELKRVDKRSGMD